METPLNSKEERRRKLLGLADSSQGQEFMDEWRRKEEARRRRGRGCLFFAIALPLVLVFIHFFVTPLVEPMGTEAKRSDARKAEWQADIDRRKREDCEGWTRQRAETAWLACGAVPGERGLTCLSDVQKRSRRCGLSQ